MSDFLNDKLEIRAREQLDGVLRTHAACLNHIRLTSCGFYLDVALPQWCEDEFDRSLVTALGGKIASVRNQDVFPSPSGETWVNRIYDLETHHSVRPASDDSAFQSLKVFFAGMVETVWLDNGWPVEIKNFSTLTLAWKGGRRLPEHINAENLRAWTVRDDTLRIAWFKGGGETEIYLTAWKRARLSAEG